ncbi:transmembrane protein, putative (macronuclear) [Tetrahymena thermophila SB210]|uniref:Transmembrane protein, putative n=1 Tax=Tetrahymena thermophila (strain SB210) TaxID=312017 RepID=W7XJE0_TETTS|nr:transmembrane protein, putative [Tetrahymena thermophila SB210]EWS74069.1 transmembrane protein, putative [Tetrahymena thermophila SB210]|eukprot:XP_012653402.1 transmembrane protein, putative [Tetrahymena thermophila SB210]
MSTNSFYSTSAFMTASSQEIIPILLGIYIVLTNIACFIFLGLDKVYSIKNKKRIQEKTLLALINYGGYCGGYIGMTLFNHKKNKKTFQYYATSLKSLIFNITLIILYYVSINFHKLEGLF